jgi:hypothetical protein
MPPNSNSILNTSIVRTGLKDRREIFS